VTVAAVSRRRDEPHAAFFYVDSVCNAWFAVEVLAISGGRCRGLVRSRTVRDAARSSINSTEAVFLVASSQRCPQQVVRVGRVGEDPREDVIRAEQGPVEWKLSTGVWFAVEVMVRLATSPRPCQLLRSPHNLIDMTATLSFYLDLLLTRLHVDRSSRSPLYTGLHSHYTYRQTRNISSHIYDACTSSTRSLQGQSPCVRGGFSKRVTLTFDVLTSGTMHADVLP